MQKPTMKDVAKHAGVSVATVSNVLNGVDHKTTENTRKKVLSAVQELNYRMDMTARSLSKGSSNLIGILLPEVYENNVPSSVLKDNPFYSELISGIEYEARVQGYDILISCINSPKHAIELVEKRMLDGIAILGHFNESFWEEIATLKIPIVLIDAYNYKDVGVNNVGVEDELGAYLATKHLITLGHKHIALGIGQIDISEVYQQRYHGFKRAITEAGLIMENCPVIEGQVNFKGGTNIGTKLLKDFKSVTAIFAAADILALGVIKMMSQFGKNIPKDLSVVGFDDLKICEYTFPSLTTIRQDIYGKGIEASKMLIRKINGEKEILSEILPVELVLRETTSHYRGILNQTYYK